MKYTEAERMVEESGLEDHEKDRYALWTSFEDQHRIHDSADPIRHADGGVRGLKIKGDSGCFSLSIHNDTNPAWVWLAMDIEDESEGGTPGEGVPECPVVQHPLVCGQDETDGSVTVTRDGENLVVTMTAPSGEEWDGSESDGSEEGTHVHVARDKSEIPSSPGAPVPGQFDYSKSTGGSEHTYTIPLKDIPAECGEEVVVAAHGASTSGETCWGGSTAFDPTSNQWALVMTHTVCCPSENPEVENVESETAPETHLLDEMQVDVFWHHAGDICVIDSDDEVLYEGISMRDLASNISKSTGGLMPQWYSEGTQYLTIRWHLPFETGNGVQLDEAAVAFCVYAEQRRHNDDPDNPWM